jgi:diguanylate cyclase (GGDEF)-like protein
MVGRPGGFADAATPFHWGVSDVLLQPFHPEVVRLRVNGWVRQQRLRRRLRGDLGDGAAPPTTDRLTRLYGHGFLHGYVDHLIAAGPNPPLAVIGFAIAKMGRINQTFGYAAGDRVLAQVGALLARAGRADDLPARFGDDRFCIVVNGAGGHEARTVADRVAAVVTQTPFAVGGERIGIELRTGVAQLTHGDDAGSLIARAFDRMQMFGLRQAS